MRPPLHVLHAGTAGNDDAPTLVLLHLFAGSALSWEPVVELLAPSCRLVVPSLRGFGQSPAPEPGATLADYADDVAEITAPLGRHWLVGHSMGGKVAALLAARRPRGLAGLVLVAPSPPTPEPIPDRPAMLAAFGSPAAAAATARRISRRAGEPRVLERLLGDSLHTSRIAWEWWVERGSRDDIGGQAETIAVPTLVVAAADDADLPPEVIEREVVRRVPGAGFTTLPGSRHMVPFDAPDALAATITAWMQRTA